MDGRAHKAELLLIAAFLLFQLAMPLRYYLGGGGTDERFSWRMFSSVRMQRCDVSVRESVVRDGEPKEQAVDLGREMQVAWVGMLERYRPAVVEKALRQRCDQASARSVSYERNCTNTDGSKSPPLSVRIDCADHSISSNAPALRGGASTNVAPALRGGASTNVAPALRGGAP